MLDEWTRHVCEELGITEDVDFERQLDLARVVAHKIERRAAPITTFLVGLAAGRAGGDAASVSDATSRVMSAARRWRPDGDDVREGS